MGDRLCIVVCAEIPCGKGDDVHMAAMRWIDRRVMKLSCMERLIY